MKVRLEIGARSMLADFGQSIDISIPMHFGGRQPTAFGVPGAKSEPLKLGGSVMSTIERASCNVEVITVIPHCQGTHTECIGHIVNEAISVNSVLETTIFLCWLASVRPGKDRQITAELVAEACRAMPASTKALVIRTQPNDPFKLERDYKLHPAPFITPAAADTIVELGIEHLIVDIPSIDPAEDGGRLEAHRRFWNIPPGVHDLPEEAATERTITEFAYVPDWVKDGTYLIDIQVAPFASDAAPSRPLLVKLQDDGHR